MKQHEYTISIHVKYNIISKYLFMRFSFKFDGTGKKEEKISNTCVDVGVYAEY